MTCTLINLGQLKEMMLCGQMLVVSVLVVQGRDKFIHSFIHSFIHLFSLPWYHYRYGISHKFTWIARITVKYVN